MKSSDEKLLREAVRDILAEEFYDYGVSPWFGPYGVGKGASKHSKASSSYGVPGGSLYGIFIQPFVDAAKVVGSELGQTGVRVVALLRTVIESALEALLPKFKANYDNIQKSQQKYLDKIKDKYKDAYKAVDEAWEHEDIQFFAFMHDPSTWLGYKAITAKPEAALSVYEMLAEGNSALLNYLRDIRNRMYGAQSPGATIPQAAPPQAVAKTEAVVKPNVIKKAATTAAKPAAKAGKQPSPAEQVAAALTDPKFLQMVAQLPLVQQMKQDAAAIDKQTGAQLQQAMAPVLNADTAEDLARASGGSWQVPQEYANLKPEEKAETDDVLVKQAKASMAAYYSSRIEEMIQQLTGMGVAENSPYVSSLKQQLANLAKYKG